MVKKGKAIASKKLELTSLFTDNTCNKEAGTSTWETMYQLLEEEQLRILETMIRVDGCDSFDASIHELVCSFLHRIAMQPKIIPYTDMVKWIIDDVDISYREFKTGGHEVIGSFAPYNLRLMYHLPQPWVTYNR